MSTTTTRLITTADGVGWLAVTDEPVSQPIPLADVLARQYPFVASPQPEGGFGISFPDLPGCFSFAETWDAVGPQAREASELWLEGEWHDNQPIPDPTYEWAPVTFHRSQRAARIDGRPAPQVERVYTAEEAAVEIGVTRARVQQLARAQGVGTRINNSRIFTESDLAVLRSRPDRRTRAARRFPAPAAGITGTPYVRPTAPKDGSSLDVSTSTREQSETVAAMGH